MTSTYKAMIKPTIVNVCFAGVNLILVYLGKFEDGLLENVAGFSSLMELSSYCMALNTFFLLVTTKDWVHLLVYRSDTDNITPPTNLVGGFRT